MASFALHVIKTVLRGRSFLRLKKVPIPEQRKEVERMTAKMKIRKDVRFRRDTVGGLDGEWCEDNATAGPETLLYLHGGGYVLYSSRTHRPLVCHIVKESGVRVFSVDYRLAPEAPFPAALEDACAAYQGLLENGLKPEQIIIAGDSAGGGLTLATLLALKQRNIPLPAGAIGISPWTDLAVTGESVESRHERDPMLRREELEEYAHHYLAKSDPKHPLASPLYGDLEGLPPLLIQVGSEEVLLDDSRRFAQRAREAGVEVELEVWDGLFHVWHFFASRLPEGRRACAKMGDFIKKQLQLQN